MLERGAYSLRFYPEDYVWIDKSVKMPQTLPKDAKNPRRSTLYLALQHMTYLSVYPSLITKFGTHV